MCIRDRFRPNHADITYQAKYGHRDYRGGGRSSARETAMRVAAGAVAKKYLNKLGISTQGYVAQIGNIKSGSLDLEFANQNKYFFGDKNASIKVAVLDLGVKRNILKCLTDRDCYLQVFPMNTTYEEMKNWNPDGYFLSNGPGDPEPLKSAQNVAKKIIENNHPLFGICLGHQIIALANGISTYKMHNGHRGINHPVKNLLTGKGEITSQNHGFAISKEEAEEHKNIEITHIHLNDETVAGIKLKDHNCFSVQYHPEASPGPHDSSYLFDQFVENIKAS